MGIGLDDGPPGQGGMSRPVLAARLAGQKARRGGFLRFAGAVRHVVTTLHSIRSAIFVSYSNLLSSTPWELGKRLLEAIRRRSELSRC
jgi:hypothetical protein